MLPPVWAGQIIIKGRTNDILKTGDGIAPGMTAAGSRIRSIAQDNPHIIVGTRVGNGVARTIAAHQHIAAVTSFNSFGIAGQHRPNRFYPSGYPLLPCR